MNQTNDKYAKIAVKTLFNFRELFSFRRRTPIFISLPNNPKAILLNIPQRFSIRIRTVLEDGHQNIYHCR